MRSLVLAILLAVPTVASAQFRARVQSPTPTSTLQSRVAAVGDLHHTAVATRGVSGSDLSGGTELRVPDGGWVYGIKLAENGDRPCHLELQWATIDNGQVTRASSSFSPCRETRSSLKSTAFMLAPPSDSRPNGPLGAATGLRVCQRNSNDRLKGVELRGAWLNPSGSAMALYGTGTSWSERTPRIERTNCNDWEHDVEACPSGKVIVGVRIEHTERASSPRAIIKGLAPICARLSVEP